MSGTAQLNLKPLYLTVLPKIAIKARDDSSIFHLIFNILERNFWKLGTKYQIYLHIK